MPEVAQIYLGNIQQNQALADQVAEAKSNQRLLEVRLQQSDRSKGRISCTSSSGMAIGIIKSRDLIIKTGDVYQTQNNLLLLVELIEEQVLILSLPEDHNQNSPSKLIQLGHLLGNQHCPIKMEGNKVYVQFQSSHHHLNKSEETIIKMVREVGIVGLTISRAITNQPKVVIPKLHRHKH